MKETKLAIVLILMTCLVSPVWAKDGRSNGGSTSPVLTEKEAEHLTFLREEEKLARDVYIALANRYGSSIFVNISASEQKHMDSVKGLIDKYGLIDPVVDDTPGVFTNTVIAGIYFDLMNRGVQSLANALEVGVEIELLDITDIQDVMLPDVIQADVERVLQNLLAGSHNHLDAFTGALE